ncbi:MAG TPA: DUF1223 domain-containing protein [Xanthomonadaceae bacterium]|jgi:hypothetical protein|nr:DUF1223 domain-containing protein [Xanthomonadaceae bacterium]
MSNVLRGIFTAVLSVSMAWMMQAGVDASAAPGPMCRATTGAQRGALVELYTSEGCSSCPPADRWFAGVAATADPLKLSLLAFHVDYWDSIGWPDRFGNGAFSERQHDRVANAGSSAVYTPQVMLGQRVGLPWGSLGALSALRATNAQTSPLALDLNATPTTDGLDVVLKALPTAAGALPTGSLYLALYENGLSTQVKAGENSGVLLHHERVVRQLLGPYPLSGTQWSRAVHVAKPGSARADHLGLTAFVQSAKGDTLQALSLPLGACAR